MGKICEILLIHGKIHGISIDESAKRWDPRAFWQHAVIPILQVGMPQGGVAVSVPWKGRGALRRVGYTVRPTKEKHETDSWRHIFGELQFS